MDIPPAPVRPDIVSVQTSPRPTAPSPTVSFSEVMAGGARALVQGARAAVNALPGSPLVAVALRAESGASATSAFGGSPSVASFASVPVAPEGPGGASSSGLSSPTASATGTGSSSSSEAASDASLQASMAQSQQMNLYYLQVQEQVNSQNRTFTALSNVLEVEHSTAKAAITNIH
jgi:hypothetical protein